MKLIVPQIFQTERLDCLIEYHKTLMSKNCSTVVREQASNFEVEGFESRQLLERDSPAAPSWNIFFYTCSEKGGQCTTP